MPLGVATDDPTVKLPHALWFRYQVPGGWGYRYQVHKPGTVPGTRYLVSRSSTDDARRILHSVVRLVGGGVSRGWISPGYSLLYVMSSIVDEWAPPNDDGSTTKSVKRCEEHRGDIEWQRIENSAHKGHAEKVASLGTSSTSSAVLCASHLKVERKARRAFEAMCLAVGSSQNEGTEMST